VSHSPQWSPLASIASKPQRIVEIIARQTGFADRDRMRRAFLRAFGQPPQVIQRNARAELAA
jgi:transcriptional regulator GlxA family with amidase domain